MRRPEILSAMGDLIRETFGEPDVQVNENTVAADIPGWDSLSHTVLMLTVEQRFGIVLAPGARFDNVGALVSQIERQLSSGS